MQYLDNISYIENIIKYIFEDKKYLMIAITHTSKTKNPKYFERMEFFGDKIIGFLIADYLYFNCTNDNEKEMSLKLTQSASKEKMAEICLKKELYKYFIPSCRAPNVLADTLEALLTAVFVDGGLECARKVFLILWDGEIPKNVAKDPKSELQEYSQKYHKLLPTYDVIAVEGTSNNPIFTIQVSIGDNLSAIAKGLSKKSAEMDAAQKLFYFVSKNNKL